MAGAVVSTVTTMTMVVTGRIVGSVAPALAVVMDRFGVSRRVRGAVIGTVAGERNGGNGEGGHGDRCSKLLEG
jgi:hypothetical protein